MNPLGIKDFPGRAVEQFRADHQGRLPQEVEMKVPPAPLSERLAIAAQACRAAGLLSCEASVREAIQALSTARPEAVANEGSLVAAVLAYDRAIRACANDPEKMSSFCSANGDDLDTLYLNMLERAAEVAEASCARSPLVHKEIP